MKQTFMTRSDEVGVGLFDSIAWLYETVLHETDPLLFDSAIVYGNEDSPEKVEFYTLESPTIDDTPARVWSSESDS